MIKAVLLIIGMSQDGAVYYSTHGSSVPTVVLMPSKELCESAKQTWVKKYPYNATSWSDPTRGIPEDYIQCMEIE